MFFSLCLIGFGCFLFFFYNVHYLILFLGIEAILLGVLSGLYLSYLGGFSLSTVFLFLLVLVCLGGFSVSMLVSVARNYGRDFWLLGFIV